MKNRSCDILFVVVLYKQRLWDCLTYRTLVSQAPRNPLFIYDNSPIPQHDPSEFSNNIHYISDRSNPGLSYAYNRAMEYASAKGYTWLLIADQDTCFADDMVAKYREAVFDHPDVKMFVPQVQIETGRYISPVKRRFTGAGISRKVPTGLVPSRKFNAINSGILVHVAAMKEAGGYNENVPLDFSDFQFIERFSLKNDAFYVIDAICTQEFSDKVQSKEQKMERFGIFCTCLKNCEKRGFYQVLSYLCIVLKRTLSLGIKYKSIEPLRILLKKYGTKK